MKQYVREIFTITEFDAEDVIATSDLNGYGGGYGGGGHGGSGSGSGGSGSGGSGSGGSSSPAPSPPQDYFPFFPVI